MKDSKSRTDEALMQELARGSEPAFNELYARYSRRILYFLYKVLRQDEAKARDFLQDIFIKVVENAGSFDSDRSFKTWIFTITANHCRNYFRDSKMLYAEETEGEPEMQNAMPVTEKIDQELFARQLKKELNQLIPVYKEAFMLRYHENMKLREIATALDCPVGTVKSRLNSATKILAKRLSHHDPRKNQQKKKQ